MEGLFYAVYEIGNAQPGGTLLHLALTVFTPAETVQGSGRITQAVNPPVDVKTRVHGTYTYMTVMPNNTHIQVRLMGDTILPPTQPIGIENFEGTLVLSKDWKEGSANYRYHNQRGDWVELTNQPVKLINRSGAVHELVSVEAVAKAVAAK